MLSDLRKEKNIELTTEPNLFFSYELAASKRTSTLKNFCKKFIGDIYMNISYITERTSFRSIRYQRGKLYYLYYSDYLIPH